MSNVVIRVENLSKNYQYGLISHGTLRQDLQSWWTRLRGKEDPNALIMHTGQSGRTGERFWALQDISFDVKQGEIIGIIGRNGAGKSTLLKILSEITTPTTGCVKLKGRVGSLLEVGTGFHPELTGRENIYLNGVILGMTKAEITQNLDEIIAFAEIEKFIDTPVKRYSSGMRVRLAFAVAAHLEPEILLIDEVLAVGDMAFQKKCLGKMDTVAKEGRTVLFVSHNMGVISALCKSAIFLDEGQIACSGKVFEIVDAYLTKVRGDFGMQKAEIFLSEELDKPAQILSIRLSDATGEPSLRYDVLTPIHIEMTFIVRCYFPSLIPTINVRTSMDHVVYITRELDWVNFVGPAKIKTFPKESGYYKASVVLPAPLLNKGAYELFFVLTNPESGRVDYQRGIFVEITDDKGSFATYPINRNGLLAIPLEWTVEQNNCA